jgi:UDP-GlcNAc:undecaprenyl-phosphate/decaprenyl-phosphate GlcNAc-1-phosphate transferase
MNSLIADINISDSSNLVNMPALLYVILGFVMAAVVSSLAIPLIHATAFINGLFAGLNGRTSHTHPIPLFGGVAVFVAFCLTTITIGASYFDSKFIYAIAGMMIMFIAGVKDDLTISKPKKKLLGQLLSIFYIVVLGDIRITSLHGFLNIDTIPYFVSLPLTVFVLLVITNGFNLIDGIDGLASGTAIMISVILGIWFYMAGNIHYSLMCSALAGGTSAFFYFNVFNKRRKLFLGDGGSLILGLILGMMIVRFVQTEPFVTGLASVNSAPALAISLFALPLFDTLRVFTVRIAQGKSPFHADRQHLHHYLLELGFTHLQATLTLVSCNFILIILSYLLQDIGILLLTLVLLGLSLLLSQFLLYKAKHFRTKTFTKSGKEKRTAELVVAENQMQ